MKGILFSLPSVPDFGGFFEDAASILGGGVSTIIDLLLGLILAPLNVVLYIIFNILLVLMGAFYNLMVGIVTTTPHPVNGSGFVLFGEPTDEFEGLQQVMESGIIPLSLLLVIFGIAIVMFVRIFDVAIGLSFDGEEAQKRLLLAPILISLWIPLANMVLVIAHGLTGFFVAVGESITIGEIFADPPDDFAQGDDASLDIMGLFESLAPGDGVTDVNIEDYFTGDAVETAVGMGMGIYMLMFISPVILIAVILALMRIMVLYVLYVLGPVGIMLWSIKWRELGELGGKIVRQFVLLALFPVPAALVIALMPVIAIGAEEAILASLAEIFGGTASDVSTGGGAFDYIGLNEMMRAQIGAAAVILVGFAPWALVLGFSTATKLAGGAAVAGGAVATGGAALGAAGAAKGLGGAASKAAEKSSKVAGAASKAKSAGGAVKSGASSAVGSNAVTAAAGSHLKDRMKDRGVMNEDGSFNTMEAASQGMAGAGSRLASSSMTGTVGTMAGKGMAGGASAVQKEASAMSAISEKRQKIREQEELQEEFAEDTDMSEEEVEIAATAYGDQFRAENAREFLERSDSDLSWEDVTGDRNRRLDTDGKEIIGAMAQREIRDADGDYEQLEEKYGSHIADRMTDNAMNVSHSDYRSAAEEMGGAHMGAWHGGDVDRLENHEDELLATMNVRDGRKTTMEESLSDISEERANEIRQNAQRAMDQTTGIAVDDGRAAADAISVGDTAEMDRQIDTSGLRRTIEDAGFQTDIEGNVKVDSLKEDLIENQGLDEGLVNSLDFEELIRDDGSVGEISNENLQRYFKDNVKGMSDLEDANSDLGDTPTAARAREYEKELERRNSEVEQDIQSREMIPEMGLEMPKVDSIRQEATQIADEQGIEEAQQFMENQLQTMMEGQQKEIKSVLKDSNIDVQSVIDNSSDIGSLDDLAADIAQDSVGKVQGAMSDEIATNIEQTVQKTSEAANEETATAVGEKYKQALSDVGLVETVPGARTAEDITKEKLEQVNLEDMGDIEGQLNMAESLGKVVEQNQQKRAEGVAEVINRANEEQSTQVEEALNEAFSFDQINADADKLISEAQSGNTDAVAGLIQENGGVDDAQAEMMMNSMIDGNDPTDLEPDGTLG